MCLGILLLSIETSRYQDIPIEHRFYIYCSQNCVESEMHFMLYCDKYNDLRFNLFNEARVNYPLLDVMEPEVIIRLLMSDSVIKFTANYICKAYERRQCATYVWIYDVYVYVCKCDDVAQSDCKPSRAGHAPACTHFNKKILNWI